MTIDTVPVIDTSSKQEIDMQQIAQNPRLVFISHSSQDTWVARQIAREVSLCGATPFLDEADVEVGDDFEEGILAFFGTN